MLKDHKSCRGEVFLEGPKYIPMDDVETKGNDASKVEEEDEVNVEDVKDEETEVKLEVNVDVGINKETEV